MALLFNRKKNKYIELKLYRKNEPDWIAYSICGGKISQKRIELFRLDNDGLFFHDAYDKEVENIINGLRNIKESRHYVFEPTDEGEFLLKSDYRDNMINIILQFRIIDMIKREEVKDNIFDIDTTYVILNEFLTQLKKEYDNVTLL